MAGWLEQTVYPPYVKTALRLPTPQFAAGAAPSFSRFPSRSRTRFHSSGSLLVRGLVWLRLCVADGPLRPQAGLRSPSTPPARSPTGLLIPYAHSNRNPRPVTVIIGRGFGPGRGRSQCRPALPVIRRIHTTTPPPSAALRPMWRAACSLERGRAIALPFSKAGPGVTRVLRTARTGPISPALHPIRAQKANGFSSIPPPSRPGS
jgi:hypothetical protein